MAYTNTATALVADLILEDWVLRREAWAVLSGEPERRSVSDFGNGPDGFAAWGRALFTEPDLGGLMYCREWGDDQRSTVKRAASALRGDGIERVDWPQVAADVVVHYK